jgi:hypothetical protein
MQCLGPQSHRDVNSAAHDEFFAHRTGRINVLAQILQQKGVKYVSG